MKKSWIAFLAIFTLNCAEPKEPLGEISRAMIYGGNDIRDVACHSNQPAIVEAARAIGRMITPTAGDNGECTGFLVGENGMFLTANSCAPSAQTAMNSTVRFGYDAASCGGPEDGSYVEYASPAFIQTDLSRGYTLLQLCGHPANLFGRLTLGFAPTESNSALAIIHHPDGGVKKVSLFDDQSSTGKCKVYPGAFALTPPGHFFESAFGYKCDTTYGSTGAPVISPSTGVVLGLHFDAGNVNPPDDINLATRAVFVRTMIEPYLTGHAPPACPNEEGNPDASCRNHCGEMRPTGCRCDAECATRPTPDCCADKAVWCGRGLGY